MPRTDPGPAPQRWADRFALLPAPARGLLFVVLVAAAHLTLLHLPYFWDEGGYYVPAALDFYHRWTLIPSFTNAHPPLPNVVLGLAWHLFGFHILVTRLVACAFAAAALSAVYALGRALLGSMSALVLTVLTAAYPIWYAQSSLAHADIFAAAFSLAGITAYLTSPDPGFPDAPPRTSTRRLWSTAAVFSLSVLSKETAVIQPVTLAVLALYRASATRGLVRHAHLRWVAALGTPVPVLALWFAYHRWKTGFTFGNPTYLRYNATANFTLAHILSAFRYRFLHLFWQRDIWVPIVLALACLFLPKLSRAAAHTLPARVLHAILLLVLANWLAFSVLGGALLTRYLLPVYPLLLLVCLSVWKQRVLRWPWLALLTLAAFISALWLNPPTYFAPEDNLTYRDMIVVHQEAIAWLQQHDPDATVLTAWPGAAELTRPELGYTSHPFKVDAIDNFSRSELDKAAAQPGDFDTALIFTTHYTPPVLEAWLAHHPKTAKKPRYATQHDLTPAEIAVLLNGKVVWQTNRDGEWAAVLRFPRSYEARLALTGSPGLPSLPLLRSVGGP